MRADAPRAVTNDYKIVIRSSQLDYKIVVCKVVRPAGLVQAAFASGSQLPRTARRFRWPEGVGPVREPIRAPTAVAPYRHCPVSAKGA